MPAGARRLVQRCQYLPNHTRLLREELLRRPRAASSTRMRLGQGCASLHPQGCGRTESIQTASERTCADSSGPRPRSRTCLLAAACRVSCTTMRVSRSRNIPNELRQPHNDSQPAHICSAMPMSKACVEKLGNGVLRRRSKQQIQSGGRRCGCRHVARSVHADQARDM